MLHLLLLLGIGLAGVYKNAEYGFQFEMPQSWEIDVPAKLGLGNIDLRNPAIKGIIAISHHLYHLEDGTSIADFAGNHSHEDPEYHHVHREHLNIHNHNGFLLEGVATRGPFAMAHFHVGKLVWFAWCNSNSKENSPVYSDFRKILDSWRFHADSPMSLHDSRVHRVLNGEALEPMNANLKGYNSWCCGKAGYYCYNSKTLYACSSSSNCNLNSQQTCQCGCTVAPPGQADYCASCGGGGWSGYRSPNPDWIWCGSSYHKGAACYAADVQGSRNDPISAISSGTVTKAGWDTTGYGNMVLVKHSQGTACYAHLDHINSWSGSVSAGSSIGGMGNSGTEAIHLHFHVRNDAYGGVQISGMPTFVNNGWPSGCTSNGGANCARFS